MGFYVRSSSFMGSIAINDRDAIFFRIDRFSSP